MPCQEAEDEDVVAYIEEKEARLDDWEEILRIMQGHIEERDEGGECKNQ